MLNINIYQLTLRYDDAWEVYEALEAKYPSRSCDMFNIDLIQSITLPSEKFCEWACLEEF